MALAFVQSMQPAAGSLPVKAHWTRSHDVRLSWLPTRCSTLLVSERRFELCRLYLTKKPLLHKLHGFLEPKAIFKQDANGALLEDCSGSVGAIPLKAWGIPCFHMHDQNHASALQKAGEMSSLDCVKPHCAPPPWGKSLNWPRSVHVRWGRFES